MGRFHHKVQLHATFRKQAWLPGIGATAQTGACNRFNVFAGRSDGLRRGPNMRYLRILALLGICLGWASFAHAQRVFVGVGVGPAYGYVGPAPVCGYGYYDYYPYACAPYGYYGPDWFVDGVFIGAGPWFHGYYGRGFYGRGYYGRGYYGYGHGYYGRGYYGRGGYGYGGRGGFGDGGFRQERGFHGGGGLPCGGVS